MLCSCECWYALQAVQHPLQGSNSVHPHSLSLQAPCTICHRAGREPPAAATHLATGVGSPMYLQDGNHRGNSAVSAELELCCV
jgi:hypothetical protein